MTGASGYTAAGNSDVRFRSRVDEHITGGFYLFMEVVSHTCAFGSCGSSARQKTFRFGPGAVKNSFRAVIFLVALDQNFLLRASLLGEEGRGVKQLSVAPFRPRSLLLISLLNCCPFEGGGVSQLMPGKQNVPGRWCFDHGLWQSRIWCENDSKHCAKS